MNLTFNTNMNVYTKSFYSRVNQAKDRVKQAAGSLYCEILDLTDDFEIITRVEEALERSENSELRHVLDKSASHVMRKYFAPNTLAVFYLERLRVIAETAIDNFHYENEFTVQKLNFTGDNSHVSSVKDRYQYNVGPAGDVDSTIKGVFSEHGIQFLQQEYDVHNYNGFYSELDQRMVNIMQKFIADDVLFNSFSGNDTIRLKKPINYSDVVPLLVFFASSSVRRKYRVNELITLLNNIKMIKTIDSDGCINKLEDDVTNILNEWLHALRLRGVMFLENGTIVRMPRTQIKLPIGNSSNLHEPFGLVGTLIDQTSEPRYFKFLSRSHNCVGYTLHQVKTGLGGCFHNFQENAYRFIGFRTIAHSSFVMEEMAHLRQNINRINNKYSELYQEFGECNATNSVRKKTHYNYYDYKLIQLIGEYENLDSSNYKDRLTLLIRITEFCFDNKAKFTDKSSRNRVKYALDLVIDFYKSFELETDSKKDNKAEETKENNAN